MKRKTPRWESELWSYLSSGDGTRCPVYQSCRLRQPNFRCPSEQADHYKMWSELTDYDAPDFTVPTNIESEYSACIRCVRNGKIFKVVRRLAIKYQEEAGIDHPPVPANLINYTDDNFPIEIREVPLKAHHGAVWQLSDCWLVHLNSNDTPARQRFTLYHEIFHILAHGKATPVFRKTSSRQGGSFNELLADYFAVALLVPEEWVTKIWPEVKDISLVAAIFEVPKPVVWLALNHLRLI